MPTNKETNLS